MKIPTTELEEIGRELDVGIGKLSSIDEKLDKLDILVEGQERMGETQERMLKVLEKIEDKVS